MNIEFYSLKRLHESYVDALKQASVRVIDSGWFINGVEVEEFGLQFSNYCGAPHFVGFGNGYDAIYVTLKTLISLGKLSERDEILVPANSFVATATAVTNANLSPLFCDVEIDTANVSLASLKQNFTKNTKAVIVVHLYGRCVEDINQIKDWCQDQNILLLEDCAQSQGARLSGNHTGTFGVAGLFSFFPGKNLGALGDAGAAIYNDESIAESVKDFSNYGSSKKYIHNTPGVNSRLDEIQAAMLLVKLSRLDEETNARKKIAQMYLNGIDNPKIRFLKQAAEPASNVFHQFVVKVEDRCQFSNYLNDNGVGNMIHYPIPIHKQKAYEHFSHYSMPNTEELAGKVISLPIGPYLTDLEVEYIIDTINKF